MNGLQLWFPKSYSDAGNTVNACRGRDWGWGGCPDGTSAVTMPQEPLHVFTYLVGQGGCQKGWEGPQPPPRVSLRQRKSPFFSQRCTSRIQKCTLNTKPGTFFFCLRETCGSLANPSNSPPTRQVCKNVQRRYDHCGTFRRPKSRPLPLRGIGPILLPNDGSRPTVFPKSFSTGACAL